MKIKKLVWLWKQNKEIVDKEIIPCPICKKNGDNWDLFVESLDDKENFRFKDCDFIFTKMLGTYGFVKCYSFARCNLCDTVFSSYDGILDLLMLEEEIE